MADFMEVIRPENNLKSPYHDSKLKTAAFWPNCPQIHITNDNWSETSFPWIQLGMGTENDPHIIENVTINAGYSSFCIYIEDSIQHFKIRNCTLSGSSDAGILLNNVTNGKIINNTCFSNSDYGIFLEEGCNNNTILKNKIFNNQIGIGAEYCYYNNFKHTYNK